MTDRAEYMREYMRKYRKQRRGEVAEVPADPPVAHLVERIAELEDEVRRLKRLLARRPSPVSMTNAIAGPPTVPQRGIHAFNSRPFTPVPKQKS